MSLSEERQKHFVHLLIDGLWGDEIIDFDEDDEEQVIREAKRIVSTFVQEQGDIDDTVRGTIAKLKRGVPEGSPEWRILYKKYYAQEMLRRGHR